MFDNGLPLNIDAQQILLHLFNLVILVGGLYILLYKPIKDFIDKRANHYKAMDEAAQDVMKQAQERKNEYDEKLKSAEEEIQTLKDKAMNDAKTQADGKLAAANEQAQKIISDAKATADREREKIIAESKEDVAKLAAQAAAKILDEKTDMYSGFVEAVNNSQEG